jgi:hypothetical protein
LQLAITIVLLANLQTSQMHFIKEQQQQVEELGHLLLEDQKLGLQQVAIKELIFLLQNQSFHHFLPNLAIIAAIAMA